MPGSRRRTSFVCAATVLLGTPCLAQTGSGGAASTHDAIPPVQAVRVAQPPRIDGRLDDQAWSAAMPATEFLQRDPDEGQPASERTELRIVFDDAAIYVGARLFDREPSRIGRRLSRRDTDADADRFTVYFDPRHDHLTGAQFQVSAAGSLADAIIYNDSWSDSSWNGVWDAAVSIDQEGWTAEMRIPLSQLRFSAADREWRQGSTLYVVWTEGREDNSYPGHFALGRDARALLTAPPDDVLLVKVSYWIGR